ncbi:MAG: hypothetical protein ABIT01_14995 [Thermoanaerobaculia bacterium]
MKRIVPAVLLALLASSMMGRAEAQNPKSAVPLPTPMPAPAATPVPCPATTGLVIGQTRLEAYDQLSRTDFTTELKVHHMPAHNQYHVDITFDGPSKVSKVIGLHYVWNPPAKLHENIEKRYGKPTIAAADSPEDIWNLPACGVRLRYKMLFTAKESTPVQEEMWVEPLSTPLKAASPSK